MQSIPKCQFRPFGEKKYPKGKHIIDRPSIRKIIPHFPASYAGPIRPDLQPHTPVHEQAYGTEWMTVFVRKAVVNDIQRHVSVFSRKGA